MEDNCLAFTLIIVAAPVMATKKEFKRSSSFDVKATKVSGV